MEEWFELFWETYPSDLSHKKKGAKSQALKAIQKLNPDEKLRNKIITNLRELMRHARLEIKAHNKTDRWPFASTWINQERWTMIEDISPMKLHEEIKSRACACGKPVDFAPTNQCWSCRDKTTPPDLGINRQALRKIGLTMQPGETAADYNARCKSWCIANGHLASTVRARTSVSA